MLDVEIGCFFCGKTEIVDIDRWFSVFDRLVFYRGEDVERTLAVCKSCGKHVIASKTGLCREVKSLGSGGRVGLSKSNLGTTALVFAKNKKQVIKRKDER